MRAARWFAKDGGRSIASACSKLAALLLLACAGGRDVSLDAPGGAGTHTGTAMQGEPSMQGEPFAGSVAPAQPRSDAGLDDAAVGVVPPGGDPGLQPLRPEGWTEATHGRDAAPNHDLVFPNARVNQITLTATPEDWQAMLDHMTEHWGPRGTVSPRRLPQPGASLGGLFPEEEPLYVPVTVGFEGMTWTRVGLRFKGNSSLRNAWSSNTDRFPLRLDFDEFEDEFPEIGNQRFHGFKWLSLSSNYGDSTHMREALAYDLLSEAGLVAAARGFYEVLLDRGDGPTSLGLYTVMEVVRDTVIPRYFERPEGNLYKAKDNPSSLAAGVEAMIADGFEPQGGAFRTAEQADYSDILALHAILHSPTRNSAPERWRSELESAFDVPGFLRFLALAGLLRHWDTYGAMAHNFYLYNDPSTERLHFVSWDHNLVLGASFGAGGSAPGGGFGGFGTVSLDKSSVGSNWPLINFLYAQPEYRSAYDAAIAELLEGAFERSKVVAAIETYRALLKPHAVEHVDAAAYDGSVDALVTAVNQQIDAALTYLRR